MLLPEQRLVIEPTFVAVYLLVTQLHSVHDVKIESEYRSIIEVNNSGAIEAVSLTQLKTRTCFTS